ncbi:hypothetical protein [Lentzea sp. E54]|uniref:hypothetical protein n=1 Tax=Lentzea xerophila TaxID=3435883 RepID=UPI003DA44A74
MPGRPPAHTRGTELVVDGVLSSGTDLFIGKAMRDGMRAENAALKRAAESGGAAIR